MPPDATDPAAPTAAPTDPAPEVPPVDTAAPLTIGDLIAAERTATTDQIQASAAAADADAKLADLTGKKKDADSRLGTGLAQTGAAFTLDTATGAVTVYEPDGAGGFHETRPKPASTAVSLAPA